MSETALITGASSGIGRELARLFARDGDRLVLVARSRERLEELARELETASAGVTVLVKDLCDARAPEEIAAALGEQGIEVDVLVNNAGAQVYGAFAGADLPRLLEMLQVNVTAVTHLTHLLLPGMLARGRGRILNVGSTGSFTPGPYNAVYCATKAYVLSFSEALAAELDGSGVTVTTLCPGATDTAFVSRYGMQNVRLFRKMMQPAEVARTGYAALRRGQRVVVAGAGNAFQVLGYQLMKPFMPLISNGMLKRVGGYIMGREGTK
jgi:short-subunit dehydrogenase